MFFKPNLKHAVVKSKKWLNAKVLQIDLRLKYPLSLEFVPGQFISISVANNVFRAYSIASDCKNSDYITIVASVAHNGIGANFLKDIKKGEDVYFVGPSGKFVLNTNYTQNITFAASSVGIAPFIPMLHKLVDDNCTSKIQLYFQIRHEEELFFVDHLTYFKNRLKNFECFLYVSQPQPDWTGLKGRFTNDFIVNEPHNTQVYICGNPNMVEETVGICKKYGVNDKQVFTEKFTHNLKSKALI